MSRLCACASQSLVVVDPYELHHTKPPRPMPGHSRQLLQQRRLQIEHRVRRPRSSPQRSHAAIYITSITARIACFAIGGGTAFPTPLITVLRGRSAGHVNVSGNACPRASSRSVITR